MGGCVPLPPPLIFVFFLFLFFFWEKKEKEKQGRAYTAGTGMGSWCGGAIIRCHLLLVFPAAAVLVALFVAALFGVAWHVTSFLVYCVCYGVMHGVMRYGDMHAVAYNILVFLRPVALLLLVCVIHA